MKLKAITAIFFIILIISFGGGPVFSGQSRELSYDPLEERLRGNSPGNVSIEYNALTGAVRFIGTDPASPIKGPMLSEKAAAEKMSPREMGLRFIDSYGKLFGIEEASKELAVMKTSRNIKDHSFIRYQQKYNDVPVFGGELIIQQDDSNNIISAASKVIPAISIDTSPQIDAFMAKNIALNAVSKWHNQPVETLDAADPDLWIYNPVIFNINANKNHLIWRIEVESKDLKPIRHLVLLDALNGKIALHFNTIENALARKIYDNANDPSLSLPGYGPVRVEGQGPTGIEDVDNTYDYMEDFYDFFLNVLGRNSVDDKGMELVATVRYCETADNCPYDNAFWSGSRKQLAMGDGNVTDDSVGHELAHGVTDYTSNFYYYMQSGALNESMSDIWGELIDLTNGRGNDSPDVRWLLFEDDSSGASRSMSNPHLFDHPDRMTDDFYICGTKDNGGVHTNSGVGNKAAYLITDGGYFNGYSISGVGIVKAAKIYYEAQSHLLTSGSDYLDFYYALYQACLNLLGVDGITQNDCEQVRLAAAATEMNIADTYCVYPKAPVCESGTPADLFFDDMEGKVKWSLSPVTGTVDPGYFFKKDYATSGIYSLYAENVDTVSDFAIATKKGVKIPYGKQVFLHFNHAYDFESEGSTMYDGGVVEYSTDGGANWYDAGAMFVNNGYDGAIYYGAGNPLSWRNAFTGTSFGYTASRLDVSSLAGQNVRFRFRVGNDEAEASDGWYIDDTRIYWCRPNGVELLGEWTHFTQNCKNTSKGIKCNIKGKLKIWNIGSQTAPSSNVKFYLSEDFLKEASVGTIKIDKSRSVSLSYSFPYGFVTSGKHVIAVIDADNTIPEANEDNNSIVYGPLP